MAVVAFPTAPAATAQINARISPDLKARGDAALLDAGFSPTQAIRALWDFAAGHADNPHAIARVLLPEQASAEDEEALAQRTLRAKAIARGSSLVREGYMGAGLEWPPEACELGYDDLKELAYAERYGEEMGWE